MNKTLRTTIVILTLVLCLWGMWYFSSIVMYIAVAGVISLVGKPVVDFLLKLEFKGRKLPSALAALLTMMLFAFGLGALVTLFAPLIVQELEVLSAIDYQQVSNQLAERLSGQLSAFDQYNFSGDERSNEAYILDQLQETVSIERLKSLVNDAFSLIGNTFVALFSIAFITFFFLKDAKMMRRVILMATPDTYMDKVEHIIDRTTQLLTRYFGGLLLQITFVTLLVSLGLYIIGIPNALLIGFLAGLINLIPYVGPMIGAVIGIFISVTLNLEMDLTSELLPLVLKVALVFASVQLIDNFIIQPYIFSNSVNAHPLEIFLVISMAGSLAGIGGMVVAVPVYSFLRIIAKEFLSEFKLVRGLTRNA